MRGRTDGLVSPFPMGATLPAVYHGDDFTQRFVAGFDDVLAPVLQVLDNLAAYVDPRLAPTDFLALLATWVGVDGAGPAADSSQELDGEAGLRRAVLGRVTLMREQGTVAGLAGAVEAATGVRPEVLDPGGVAWSREPGGARPPGRPGEAVVVRVPHDTAVTAGPAVAAAVRAAAPAHVRYRLEASSAPAAQGPSRGDTNPAGAFEGETP